MTEPRRPYYVSFTHDRMPQQIDHSRLRPGPPGGSGHRVGHTSVRPTGRLVFAWDAGPVQAGGLVPLHANSVNVYFRLTDFVVAISSGFAVRSCAYEATRRHEFEAHLYDPIRIFHSYREVLIQRLNAISVPTREAPLHVPSSQVQARQEEVERRVVAVIGQTRRELARDLSEARDRQDSPESYRLAHNQCTDAQWASGR